MSRDASVWHWAADREDRCLSCQPQRLLPGVYVDDAEKRIEAEKQRNKLKNVIEHLTESAKVVCENLELSDGGDGGSDDGGSGRF